jgi:hypothetical protein
MADENRDFPEYEVIHAALVMEIVFLVQRVLGACAKLGFNSPFNIL